MTKILKPFIAIFLLACDFGLWFCYGKERYEHERARSREALAKLN